MKVLVTGVNGQLGYDVIKELNKRNIECIGCDIKDFDITDFEQTKNFILKTNPDAVIHCAAYTAVDKAEDEKDICHKVNVIGTSNIAKTCKIMNAKMIYISTDYVFPGTGETFYEVNDKTGPLSVYGKTKLDGENAVKEFIENYFIVRISWVFGINGNNFIKTMLRLSETKKELNVVADQIGSPTYTADLAPLLCDMVVSKKYGTYHATNEGICSWAEFAQAIFKKAEKSVKVNPIPTSDYKTKAVRPLNSRMSKDKLVLCGFKKLPHWENALERYIKEIAQEGKTQDE